MDISINNDDTITIDDTGMDIKIRAAVHDDAEVITDMLGQLAHEIDAGGTFQTDAEAIRRHGFSDQPLFHCLIAEHQGTPIGLALFFRIFSTDRGHPGVYVQDLWVGDTARKQGLGARLLSAVIEQAADQWQATYLTLTVYANNQNAIDFYQRLGFLGNPRDCLLALDGAPFQQLRTGR